MSQRWRRTAGAVLSMTCSAALRIVMLFPWPAVAPPAELPGDAFDAPAVTSDCALAGAVNFRSRGAPASPSR